MFIYPHSSVNIAVIKEKIQAEGVLFQKNRPSTSSEGLYLNKDGIGYQESAYHIFVPWHNLHPDNPAHISATEQLCINLICTTPGIGFVIHRFPLKGNPTPPFTIEGKQLVVTPTWKHEIHQLLKLIEEMRTFYYVDAPTPGRFPIDLDATDFKQQTVCVHKQHPLRFPLFCPITGKQCNTAIPLGSLRWKVSDSVNTFEKQRLWIRYGALIVIFIATLVYGHFVLQEPLGLQALFKHGLLTLLGFSLLPFVWYYTRDHIYITKDDPTRAWIFIRDPDYFHAFLDLNTPPKNKAPEKRGIDMWVK